jgi:glyoxalase family protein
MVFYTKSRRTGRGFATDEPMESLGERLVLPPFLESRRAAIERGLKPI